MNFKIICSIVVSCALLLTGCSGMSTQEKETENNNKNT